MQRGARCAATASVSDVTSVPPCQHQRGNLYPCPSLHSPSAGYDPGVGTDADWQVMDIEAHAGDELDLLARLSDAGLHRVEILSPAGLAPTGEVAALAPGKILLRLYVTPEEAAAVPVTLVAGLTASLGAPRPLDSAWRDGWERFVEPVRAGRLRVRPPWIPPETDSLDVVIDPTSAFGTGAHPTTRLCLHCLDRLVRPGRSVLDVGSGSGVLSIAAARLGAAPVVALDTDPAAVRATREAAARNGLEGAIRTAATPVQHLRGRFDLVVANILTPVLLLLRAALVTRMEDHGVLVLSGVLSRQVDEVAAGFAPLRCHDVETDAGWCALVLRAPVGAPRSRSGDDAM